MEAKKIDFRALEEQRTLALKNQLKTKLRQRQVGKDSSLRREVLACVVEAQYENASLMLDEFMELKKMYSAVLRRAEPHIHHAKDLVNAIRLKRDFPNLSALPISKQQEILDHAVSHFEELKMTLRIIEHISRDEAVKDLRSTVWVLRIGVYALAAILVTAFFTQFSHALLMACFHVFNHYTNNMFNFISRVL